MRVIPHGGRDIVPLKDFCNVKVKADKNGRRVWERGRRGGGGRGGEEEEKRGRRRRRRKEGGRATSRHDWVTVCKAWSNPYKF